MAIDTVTVRLGGEVPLPQFAVAISRFDNLVRALSKEVADGEAIEWLIDDLQWSSAIATVRGSGTPDAVERVVVAYGNVGKALAGGEPIPYSPAVGDAARGLTSVLNGRVHSVDFETALAEFTVVAAAPKPVAVPAVQAYGAVTGRVQTLTNRRSLRFTLYDVLYDRAVSCYLQEGREEIMRDAWGRHAVVEGLVRRDAAIGRPLSIRQVSAVTPLDEGSPTDYLHARGIAPSLTGLSPEAAVRRLRDA